MKFRFLSSTLLCLALLLTLGTGLFAQGEFTVTVLDCKLHGLVAVLKTPGGKTWLVDTERDERQPVVSEWPGILSFLGFYPCAEMTPADCVLKARRILGLSQYGFGRKVKVIAKDVREWEHGVAVPPPAILAKVQQLVTDTPVVGLTPM